MKAAAAETGPGNVAGSTVPYTARLEGFPDIPLYCSKCEGDWRSFEGVKRRNNGQIGIPQGTISRKIFPFLVANPRERVFLSVGKLATYSGDPTLILATDHHAEAGSKAIF